MTQELVLPPHNINAEEGVLGSLLLSGDVYREIEGMLKPCDFYSERNRRLYGACVSLRGRSEKINQATVAQQLNAAREPGETSGRCTCRASWPSVRILCRWFLSSDTLARAVLGKS